MSDTQFENETSNLEIKSENTTIPSAKRKRTKELLANLKAKRRKGQGQNVVDTPAKMELSVVEETHEELPAPGDTQSHLLSDAVRANTRVEDHIAR